MHSILFYNNVTPAMKVWIYDVDAAYEIADALKSKGYKIIWEVHITGKSYPHERYIEDYNEWLNNT